MKCLIVDDDKFERDGIIYLIKKMNFPFIISEARNGRLALSIMEHEIFDIVITDIKMPVMDGMAFLKEAKLLQPDCVYIIYSGYSDFAYAKQAISLKILEFLVKPVSESEFYNVISQSIQIVTEKQTLQIKDFFESLVMGNESNLSMSLSGRLGIFQINCCSLSNLEKFQDSMLKYNSKNIIFKITENVYGLWLESSTEILKEFTESFRYQIFRTPIVLSNKVTSREQIKEIYSCQLSFVKTSLFSNKKSVLMEDEWNIPEKTFDSIDSVDFLEYLKNTYFVTEKLIQSISSIVDNSNHNIKKQLLSLNNTEDLVKIFEDNILSDHDNIIGEVKAYISQNYQNAIGIEDISASVFLNSSYLCTVFKKKTGITLIQYLTNYRIKKACTLLAEGQLKNTEIAQKVGYKNISYFNMVFKAKMHVTPTSYRKEFGHKK